MRTILVILFLIFQLNLASAAIKVECNYNYSATDELLKRLKNDKSVIARALKDRLKANPVWNKITFIVDGKKIIDVELHMMAPETPMFKYSVKSHSEYILIKEYFFKAESASYILSDKYYISRLNGQLSGEKYAANNYSLPYFKAGDYMWDIEGQCKPIKLRRTFF